MIGRAAAVALGSILLATACVHVPNEAPELSREIGARMLALRSAHLAKGRAYMDSKRVEVHRFIVEQWVPTFTRTALESPAVKAEIGKATTTEQQVELFTGLGLRIQKQIDAKRTEMMRPIGELERELVSSIQNAHEEAAAANAALTALLAAHAGTTEKQEQLLQKFKLDEKLASSLTKAERVVGLMTAGKDAMEQNRGLIDEILSSLRN